MGHTTWGWTGDEGRHAGVVVPYGGRGTARRTWGMASANQIPSRNLGRRSGSSCPAGCGGGSLLLSFRIPGTIER